MPRYLLYLKANGAPKVAEITVKPLSGTSCSDVAAILISGLGSEGFSLDQLYDSAVCKIVQSRNEKEATSQFGIGA